MQNGVNSNQMPLPSMASDLGLHCVPISMSTKLVSSHKRVEPKVGCDMS